MNNPKDKIQTKEVCKNNAAKVAVEEFIYDNMVIGVGTGTTMQYFISHLKELIKSNNIDIVLIPSSYDTRFELRELSSIVSSLIEYPEIDLYFDGADLITTDFTLIKGGGGAMLREKLVASASQEFIVLVDETKYPKKLIEHPVPVEIIPEACNCVIKPIFELGGRLKLRYAKNKSGPVISDNGNIVGDVYFDQMFNPKKMERDLNNIPGILENGLFPSFCDKIIIGKPDSVNIINVCLNSATSRQI